MELLLWRWSTTAQIASALMIAVFFIVLTRSVRRSELQSWVNGWLANLAALAVTVIFWFLQPTELTFLIVRVAYIFTKTLFVALLAIGAWRFVRPKLGAQVIVRLDKVRERLKAERVRGHQIGFAGHAYMAVRGDSEAAMKAADKAMYAEKALKPGGRRRAG